MADISFTAKRLLPGRLVSAVQSTAPDNTLLLATAKELLAVETTASDALIQRLINAAVAYVERAARVALFDQSWTAVFDSFPDNDALLLVMRPLKTVTSFTTYDELDAATTSFAGYTVDTAGARLMLKDGQQWPVDLRALSAVKVVYVVGHGTTVAALPPELVQAVMLLVGHWYSGREAVGCVANPEMAYSVSALIGIRREFML